MMTIEEIVEEFKKKYPDMANGNIVAWKDATEQAHILIEDPGCPLDVIAHYLATETKDGVNIKPINK